MTLEHLNVQCNKAMPFVTPIGVALGLLLGSRLAPFKELSTVFFAIITFVGALGISYRQFALALRRLKDILFVLVSAHVLLPLLTKVVASLVFSDPDLVTGFILLSSIPIAVSSFIWCTIFDGDGPLALSLILLDTLLSPLITPLTIRLLTDASVVFDSKGIITSLMIMIVIPSLLGMLFSQYFPKASKVAVPYLNPFIKLLLVSVVVIHIGQLSGKLAFSWLYIPLALVNVLVIALSFVVIWFLATHLLKADRASVVSMTYTGGMRNISAALILATQFFPPRVSLPVILGILLQQTFVGFLGSVLFSAKQSK
ncbi:MAG: bile acid:sodium symporter family protein [Spirochaetia bacterium]|nr:bile acid:sodium symporter family protein [Spirochaetia bacterium]NCC88914.1 bile acid:sodium symporter family protein [Spirochaetia bacterium]